jgi:hypothetical protein
MADPFSQAVFPKVLTIYSHWAAVSSALDALLPPDTPDDKRRNYIERLAPHDINSMPTLMEALVADLIREGRIDRFRMALFNRSAANPILQGILHRHPGDGILDRARPRDDGAARGRGPSAGERRARSTNSELERGEYLFQIRKIKVPFSALSDGYKAFIGWVGDLLYHVSVGCPAGKKLVDNCGVVLVDEIDLHIHPEWQPTIIPTLARSLPNCNLSSRPTPSCCWNA